MFLGPEDFAGFPWVPLQASFLGSFLLLSGFFAGFLGFLYRFFSVPLQAFLWVLWRSHHCPFGARRTIVASVSIPFWMTMSLACSITSMKCTGCQFSFPRGISHWGAINHDGCFDLLFLWLMTRTLNRPNSDSGGGHRCTSRESVVHQDCTLPLQRSLPPDHYFGLQ